MSTTTTSTTTTTLPVHGPFSIRRLKVTRLNKAPGEQRISIESDELDGFAARFDPLADDLVVELKIGPTTFVSATIPGGDPDWKSNGSATKFKWRAKTAAHPAGLHSVKITAAGGPFNFSAKYRDLNGTAAAGASSFLASLTVGTDPWSGPTPPCELSGNGKTLNCR
jgi:hypothetical protein